MASPPTASPGPHPPHPPRSDWRALRQELDNASVYMARLQSSFAGALQQSNETEARLRTRVQELEAERQSMRLELDTLRRENEELKRDAREHVCLTGGEEHPDVHRLREELDIAKRNLRHATKLIHDWSGQLIETPSPEVHPRRRHTMQADAFRQTPGASSPIAGPSSAAGRRPFRTVRSSSVTAEPSEPSYRDHESLELEDVQEGGSSIYVPEGEVEADASSNSGLTGVTYDDNVPTRREPPAPEGVQPPRASPAGEPPVEEPMLQGHDTLEDEPVSPEDWEWVFVDLPACASTEVAYGPMSAAELAVKIGWAEEEISEWRPIPSRRVKIRDNIALYWNPTYIEYRGEPPRTVIVNWGGPAINEEQQRYIWPSNRTAEYHTFLLVNRGQDLEWWYTGKMQWVSTRSVPPWPDNPELQRAIAFRMRRKWGIGAKTKEVVRWIEQREIEQLSIELVSNEMLVEESRQFVEDTLQVEEHGSSDG